MSMINKECYEAVCRNLKEYCLKEGEGVVTELSGIDAKGELEKFPGNLIYDAIKKLAHQGYLQLFNDNQLFKINDLGYNFFINFK